MARTILNLPFSGEALQQQRERAGLSRPALALACASIGAPVSPQHLGRLERNEFRPRPKLLSALAAALHIEVDALLAIGAQA